MHPQIAVPVLLFMAFLLGCAVPPPAAAGAATSSAAVCASDSATNAAPAGSDPAGEDWLAAVAADLGAREYRVSLTPGGLQAPNRAQNLRTWFEAGGIEILPRNSAADPAWCWSWKTEALGREGALRPAGAPPALVDVHRVEYRHDGWTEWYENRPEGIEQGFTIVEAPPGPAPLLVLGEIGGTLLPRPAEVAGAIDFAFPGSGSVLRYGGLVVTDARGATLPSSLELADGGILLRVEDAEAVYPIVIDPVLTSPDWIAEGNQNEANFGQSVATAGDVNGDGYSDVIISAPGYDDGETNEGKVWVYPGSANGVPSGPLWSAQGDQANARFGAAVAPAGDVNGDGFDDVLVGTPYFNDETVDEGRVFLYYGSADGPSAAPSWTAESNQADSQYGSAVAPAGDVNRDGYDDFVVGAYYYANGQAHEGRIYVYYGSDTTPGFPWTAELNEEAAQLGRGVGGAGDVNGDGYADVVAGAPTFNNAGDIGRIYVYFGSETGMTSPPWHTGSPDWDGFGMRCAGAGDVDGDGYADILVGAPANSAPLDQSGKVYLFRGSADGPVEPAAWSMAGDQEGCRLGEALATAGDVNADGYADVIIGSENYDGPSLDEGKAYIYLGSPFGLAAAPCWEYDPDQAGASFGASVATAGDVNGDGFSDVIVGADSLDMGQVNEGRGYIFLGSSEGPQSTPGWVTESNQALAKYGYAVAAAGDVNGDGFGDVLIGAESYDNGENDEGAAFIFRGTHAGLEAAPIWWAQGNQEWCYLGCAVAGAGDVNGDGLDDVLIGAENYTGVFESEGCALLWYGTTGGLAPGNPENAPWRVTGGQAEARLGFALAGAGDVNGDGFADVIVGAYGYDHPQVDEGAAFVYHGGAEGLAPTEAWFHDCDHPGANYGAAVSSAGDFNGDGYSDVIVGSYLYDHPTTGEGAASVYLGSPDGVLPGAPFWYAEGNQENGWLGKSVACAGDVNGDGFSDVLVGAPEMDWPAVDGGLACVWHGAAVAPPPGNPDNADWRSGRNWSGADFGWHVAGAGDVNGDGYSDIVVGAPWDGTDVTGCAYVWHGSPDGVEANPTWEMCGTQNLEYYGLQVASAGDVNADGFSDILVGAPRHSNGQGQEGRAFLYHGNESRGVSRLAQQWQPSFARPIATGGQSDEQHRFGLAAFGRTPAGRGRVRLVWEVEPHGTPFDGEGVSRSGWWMTGAPAANSGSGIVLLALPAGLTAGEQYRWRLRFETRNPLFPRSKWLYLAGNGGGEADLRLSGGGSAVPPVLAGTGPRLAACVPNPFSEATRIGFTLAARTNVRVTVHDVTGRLVRTLDDGPRAAGSHYADWDGRDGRGELLPSGMYFLRFSGGKEARTQQVVLIHE